MTGATLSASYSGVRTDAAPQAAWFKYGTSANALTNTVYTDDILLGPSGSFSAVVSNLSPATTYYYQAYMTVWNGKAYVDIKSSVKSFTTRDEGHTTEDKPGYLSCGEIPTVKLSGTTRSGYETFPYKSDYSSEDEYNANRSHWFRYGVSGNSNQMVVTHTFIHNNKQKRNYSLLYDKTKRAALWVAFAMNADAYPWSVDRSDKWVYDPALDTDWQPNLSEAYQESSTYSRGHQVASNDRRTTIHQTRQTTYFSNMTPQLSGFNGGVWSSLEGDIQNIGSATSGSDTLYVVTGPIFDDDFETTPDRYGHDCAIPSQYFKCIMKVHFSGGNAVSAVGAAYLLDHENSGAERQNVKISYIEQLTGFSFFSNIPESIRTAAKNEVHPTSYFSQKRVATR